ncbi:hypothetical protein [Capillimicrobium parvum]|uniref:hypothetical protein n=1 Tax=Capillimicrobium parvum TaxID=2884022 RepID=UPI00216B1005|nr:hypothetical protein [Capillimicrobium parvum]
MDHRAHHPTIDLDPTEEFPLEEGERPSPNPSVEVVLAVPVSRADVRALEALAQINDVSAVAMAKAFLHEAVAIRLGSASGHRTAHRARRTSIPTFRQRLWWLLRAPRT